MVMPKIIVIIIITVILYSCSVQVQPGGDHIAAIVDGHYLAIEHQPDGNKTYVTDVPDTLTLFDAEAFVLLAHDHLAGQYLSGLAVGDEVIIQLENGQVAYTVTDIERFTALDPLNPYGDLVDEYGHRYTSHEVYLMIYGIAGRLVLQTCADNARDRIFWIGVIDD